MTASPDRSQLAHLRHDLRTPLNQIIGYSELLAEEAAASGHLAYAPDLQKINTAARTLLHLINANLTDDRLTLAGDIPAESVSNRPRGGDGRETSAASAANAAEDAPAPLSGRILVVDDHLDNREVLARRLTRQGHSVEVAGDGREALLTLRARPFDLVLLDVMMPILDGYGALLEIKADPALRHLPVIMVSALDELSSVVRCIERGAEDYLPKPFNPTVLRARIGAGLEKKRFRTQEQLYVRTIEETQQRLQSELHEAENYIRSVLPAPLTSGPVVVDWRLIPSTELGGDAFGYHWIDADHFAMYLLDVCGHGVGAALLSVAASNVLRTASLPGVDFRDPGALLTALNELFLMERQNGMYFTIWYGVWRPARRMLRYASAGHPPALLARSSPDGSRALERLRTPGMILGGMSGTVYRTQECAVPTPAQLYVLSDGVFEIDRPEAAMWQFTDFERYLATAPSIPAGEDLDRLYAQVKTLHGPGNLDDDFSIMRFDF